ncbi:MAG: hypothetical protein LBR27_00190 [Bifidobacteriaceae bacterium]|jgi:hypothetical protein|nr:hypothetical protein [Bifidobacteriaceae bacterium]
MQPAIAPAAPPAPAETATAVPPTRRRKNPAKATKAAKPEPSAKKKRQFAIMSLLAGLISLGCGGYGAKRYLEARDLYEKYCDGAPRWTETQLHGAINQYLNLGVIILLAGVAALLFGLICVITSHKKLVQLIIGIIALAAAVLCLVVGVYIVYNALLGLPEWGMVRLSWGHWGEYAKSYTTN